MKTTQFRILVAVIALCLLLTSCTQQPVETQPPETQPTTAPTKVLATEPSSDLKIRKVHVAYMETDLASVQIVESFVSEDIELVPVVLPEESFDDSLLGHSAYIDVILIPGSTQINPAVSVNHCGIDSMDSLILDIIRDTDYYPVLDAGRIDGHQYYLPLRFQLPYMLTTKTQLDGCNISLDLQVTMKERMQIINKSALDDNNDKNAVIVAQSSSDIGSALYDTLRFSGEWDNFPTGKEAPVDETVLTDYAQYIMTVWEQTQKAAQEIPGAQFCHPYPLSNNDRICLIQGQGSIPEIYEIYNTICQERGEVSTFLNIPHYYNNERITADITLYAAIVHTQDMYAVQEFLCHAFTTPEGQGTQQGLSVCRTAVQCYLDRLEQQSEKSYNDGIANVKIAGLSASVRKVCEGFLNLIAEGSIRNAYWERVFSHAMGKFHNGEADFETCLEDLKERLYGAPDETKMSVFDIVLSDDLKREIDEELTYAYYGRRYPSRELSWCIYDGREYVLGDKSYYGNFNGSIAVHRDTEHLIEQLVYNEALNGIVDLAFRTRLDIYRNGVFYRPDEAYKQGFITEADAAVIAERLESFEAALKTDR